MVPFYPIPPAPPVEPVFNVEQRLSRMLTISRVFVKALH
jgi:hypothetical protein